MEITIKGSGKEIAQLLLELTLPLETKALLGSRKCAFTDLQKRCEATPQHCQQANRADGQD